MNSRLARWLVPLALLTLSCAGPAELARRGDAALAEGDPQRAFELAVKAIDREPGNARARATADAAARTIAGDWQRRIRGVAAADTLAAAEQVLELAAFRVRAARYATLEVDSAWAGDERDLRRAAARVHYQRGEADLEAARPKAAVAELADVERFVPGYADVARLVRRASDQAATRVAFLPLRGTSAKAELGRQVADAWRTAVARGLEERHARFTRVVPGGEVERVMTVAEMGRLSREDAVRIGRRVGARLVVWGMLGSTETDTRSDRFDDFVQRRVTERDDQQQEVVRWVDIPMDVVSRERTVRIEVEYEVIATDDEVAVARQDVRRSMTARTVWASRAPDGDLDAFALVSDQVRQREPERANRVETRWKAVAGARTSVKDVLRGVRGARGHPAYQRDLLPRFYPGASGPVFLDDLPPADDLAYAALIHAWDPLLEDLVRMDALDEPDLIPQGGQEE
jgi:hypothetical protein